jgi:hypothetical protein
MVAAAMAVVVAGGGGCCRWQRWRSLSMVTARADMVKSGRGSKGEVAPVARHHPAATARARAMAMAMARETVTARGTAREMARARARATASRQQQQLSTAAAAAATAIPPSLLCCSPANFPSCQCCCYVFAEAVAGWVWVA